MEGKVRARSANFTSTEKQVLLSLVNKYKDIVENKRTDNIANFEKTSTWAIISQEFNSQSPAFVVRSVDSLKKYYENLKKGIRKKAALERKEMYQTGGGKPYTKTSADDELLLTLVNNKTVYGLENPFDSDKLPGISQDHIYFKRSESHNKENEVPLIENIDTSEIVDDGNDNMENVVTIEVEDDNDQTVVSTQKWRKYKPADLRKPKSDCLRSSNRKEVKAIDPTRRRPAPIRALTSSALGEKYKVLVEKKIEYVECLKLEHELRCEALKLDIELKKKQLNFN